MFSLLPLVLRGAMVSCRIGRVHHFRKGVAIEREAAAGRGGAQADVSWSEWRCLRFEQRRGLRAATAARRMDRANFMVASRPDLRQHRLAAM